VDPLEGASLSNDDYRINAQVRQVLVRRNIDLTRIEHGVTNSVVYIWGSLVSLMSHGCDDPDRLREEEIALAGKLDKALRSLPGVRDVIYRLKGLVRLGRKWKRR
jgi:hypothetical protein